MKAFQIKNNIINLNFVQKISQNQPYRGDNNRLMYDVEFTFINGTTEKYTMTHEKYKALTSKRKEQLSTFQINNNIINLNTVQRITHGKPFEDENEVQCFDVEFLYNDGRYESHDITYDKFQHLIEICDKQLTFVVDDYINTKCAEEIK